MRWIEQNSFRNLDFVFHGKHETLIYDPVFIL